MARRVSQTERDASEFGIGVRCGGWRLGLLVARNVAPAKPGRPKADGNHSPENEKVSMNRFAELANVAASHVKYYYDAWEFAAQAGLVPSADKIALGDDDVCIDVDAIEDEENDRTHWVFFYKMARNPPEKPSAKKDSEKQEKEKPEPPKAKPEEVDQDFGVADEIAPKDELEQIDSSIQRNELLEILESIQALTGRLTRVDNLKSENVALVNQIGSASMDLSTTAISMAHVEEKEGVTVE